MGARKKPYVPDPRVEEVREELKMYNANKLCERIGVTRYSLNSFRSGETMMAADVFLRVCDALKYDLSQKGAE